ncbi:MAG: hypothetical protein AB2598_13215 [Candidatus Thiodiazotropha sp.]
MKRVLSLLGVCCFLLLGQQSQAVNLNTEPCINGDVSVSGFFASQIEEDNFLAERDEPCIHGD